MMTFDDITGDGRLWAVRYEGEDDNILYSLFDRWNDVLWLRDFFKANSKDLESYFKITNINDAIKRTIDDSERLEAIMMDISPEANLDMIFRPLSNSRIAECLLGKEKARLKNLVGRTSWLRIYAIKLAKGIYIVTGGAIKLTATMQERQHTAEELLRIEQVRDFLLNERIIDDESFIEYIAEL
ncbi:MAG: hypothetical protein NC349_04910 [Paenibacillus sp.]|nr:hypothetical protein [Paenibacillus sp.]